MDITTIVIAVLAGAAGLAIGILVGQFRAAGRYDDLRADIGALSATAAADSSSRVFAMADASFKATAGVVAPVQESLATLADRLETLERHGASWQAQLKQQVELVRLSGEELRAQTRSLADALRRPQVRGHWGEMQLRRSLEIAGLSEHCTFEEQVSAGTTGGLLRPDVVVSMTGGKVLVIDSKTPLDAFLSAGSTDDAAEQREHLHRHALQVRRHMEALAAKAYWRQFETTPEFVVMFLPGEAIFAQALQTDPSLIDDAARNRVMLATPTTLIAMLKTVGYAWSQDAVAQNATAIHRAATEVYERLATAGAHLDKVGRSLASAVGSYNAFVGSLESRVLVSARRLHDLEVGTEPPPAFTTVTEGMRPLSAPELVVDGADTDADGRRDDRVVISGPPGAEQWIGRAVGE